MGKRLGRQHPAHHCLGTPVLASAPTAPFARLLAGHRAARQHHEPCVKKSSPCSRPAAPNAKPAAWTHYSDTLIRPDFRRLTSRAESILSEAAAKEEPVVQASASMSMSLAQQVRKLDEDREGKKVVAQHIVAGRAICRQASLDINGDFKSAHGGDEPPWHWKVFLCGTPAVNFF